MELSRYNKNWPIEFEQERKRIESVLGSSALRIEHVGSTSVPGLQAKPVIDIQVSVRSIDLPLFSSRLREIGYRHLPTEDPPVDIYPFFHKPARWPTTHHLHLCEIGSEQEKSHIAFRNWLRCHDEDRDYYGALKDKLAMDVDDNDIKTLFKYTDKKGPWVQEITQKALRLGFAE